MELSRRLNPRKHGLWCAWHRCSCTCSRNYRQLDCVASSASPTRSWSTWKEVMQMRLLARRLTGWASSAGLVIGVAGCLAHDTPSVNPGYGYGYGGYGE